MLFLRYHADLLLPLPTIHLLLLTSSSLPQTLVIRDWWMCMIISVMFEFLEYSLEHQLPNFSECWWDHASINITALPLCIPKSLQVCLSMELTVNTLSLHQMEVTVRKDEACGCEQTYAKCSITVVERQKPARMKLICSGNTSSVCNHVCVFSLTNRDGF